jgi:quinol monooxygenase YgiN
MNRFFFGVSATAAALVLSACGEPPARTAADTTTHAEASRSMPAAAAVLSHEVKDYDAWRAVFDEHASARKSAGIKGGQVHRSADHPNTVVIYLAADSGDAIGKFLADPELKSTMQRAGVISAPTAVMLTPVEDRTVNGRALPGVIIKHKVADFDQWKTAFDAHAATRAKAGVIGHAVNRVTDSPNTVVVYLQAENLDALRQLSSSEDMKSTMMKAGVQGPPELNFVQAQK